ncbi:Uncharacterized conserved protein YkwD, contains CAP (CSP/antigen 5/PR1) domain [Clostridium cavendishii DSM 21758]|uniref:Uncharacterized conserved protein YkwD, contains CAP (CSP/antigen 5/PR1) domain n=1 Tax=Clostridium cavendishii DSM 21758 TaxID=1121302 RepID=A0A1M6GBH6_9CLOT|nr:CAP domain-containing protein [Clostridium cavendishii]SHJ07310.1 Uncharacterized conserved protein YkwD, contains CAP (CSP/antigen 5/PR1) domain [Clostridium cavendishii DSM 21758]
MNEIFNKIKKEKIKVTIISIVIILIIVSGIIIYNSITNNSVNHKQEKVSIEKESNEVLEANKIDAEGEKVKKEDKVRELDKTEQVKDKGNPTQKAINENKNDEVSKKDLVNDSISNSNSVTKKNIESSHKATVEETPKQAETKAEIERVKMELLANNYQYTYDNELENEVLALVNEFRTKNGLAPLALSSTLRESARYKSNSMLQLDYFAHSNPQYGNKDCMYLMRNVFGVDASYYSENILSRLETEKSTAKQIFEQWRNSPPHREDMLSSEARKTGIGIVRAEKTIIRDGQVKGKAFNLYGTEHFTN